MNTGCFKRLLYAQPNRFRHVAGAAVTAMLMTACIALAQEPAANITKITIPDGYTAKHSVDMGGRAASKVGSGAMYDTLVNMQSGLRGQGETLDMHALPTNRHSLADHVHAFGTGFGGDPYNYAKLDVNKSRIYEFSGTFRRDRSYSDYDLLGNPGIPSGLSIPIGPSASPTGTLAWPQVQHSTTMFNTVRRMTDTGLTLLPQSRVSFRFGYSQNVMEGPSLSPAYTVLLTKALLQEYQRNSTDEYMGAIDWTPVEGTRVTYEQRVHRYKSDSYFTLDPNGFLAQEADGTPAYLGNYDATSAVYPISNCNTNSMLNATTILYPSQNGGKPIIDPACAVLTSYLRSQPTRVTMPTETVRFQSSSLKNLVMNGQVSYSWATMNMPHYIENAWGLSGVVRNISNTGGYAKAKREVFAADYGVTWQVSKTFSLSDQIDFVSNNQPGSAYIPLPTTLSTAKTTGNETVNYTGTLTSGTGSLPHGNSGALAFNYFGNEQITNSVTGNWEATPKANFALTYRYSNRNIGQGANHKGPIPATLSDPVGGTVAISENGGIFNAAYRPVSNWDINGSVEVFNADNAFTTMTARQTRHYRVHTKFRPKSWAAFSAAFNDLERHNNTNNNAAYVTSNDGPLNHVDHSRSASLSGVLTPSEHYSVNFDYAYTDVYTATNICFTNGAATGLAGTATLTASGAPNLCVSGTQWKARSFSDAPTQTGSVGVTINPSDKVRYGLGYRISAVNGSQFFTDARAVNGSLQSAYQTPYANVAWTLHPGLVWKAEYNYFGYGEGGASGAQYCTTTATSASISSSAISPCASMSVQTGMNSSPAGMTAPRNFHANNISLGVHYEF
jgi:hypothetical protein